MKHLRSVQLQICVLYIAKLCVKKDEKTNQLLGEDAYYIYKPLNKHSGVIASCRSWDL